MVTTVLEKPLAMAVSTRAALAIVGLQGECGITGRDGLIAQLEAVPACDVAIIDMRQVTGLDATTFACFMQLKSRLRPSGEGVVRIVGLNPSLRRLQRTADRDSLFELFDTISAAMGEYGYTVNEHYEHRCGL